MSTKRIRFAVAGIHPLLYLARDYLIIQGYELVPSKEEQPDFWLYGAEIPKAANILARYQQELFTTAKEIGATPTFLLSSSSLYSDKTPISLDIANKLPMAEDHALVVPSTLEPTLDRVLHSITAENVFLCRSKNAHTMVVRPFNVYGPELSTGVIPSFIRTAQTDEPLQVHSPGYQTRCFLHSEDFLICFSRLLTKFLLGARGIYNVGSTEEIAIKRVADSIWQLTHGPNSPIKIEEVRHCKGSNWWKIPDITRVSAFTTWNPTVSFRKGLWRMLCQK